MKPTLHPYKIPGLLAAWMILFMNCGERRTQSWTSYVSNTGTYSSARTVHLNNDGVLDIVMGAGGEEEKFSDTAVLALDGANGKIIWAIPGINQYVGSAIFQDITGDSIADIFIGGRWAQFSAIDGSSGRSIWSFYPERKRTDGSDGGWYNFTTPQWIADQDGDGLKDILVANGGDARAAAGDTNRPAGRIVIISSATGKVLAKAVVPDGKETYMSVVCDDNQQVYVGTGGETIGGHLYRTSISAIMKGDIREARIVASSEQKGFVASPVLLDINKDNIKDIIINTASGKMLAINGRNDSLLWKVEWPGTEAYTLPAPGFFNEDSVPDFYGNFAIGVFPALNRSIRFMVDGRNGNLIYADTFPAFQYASAIIADLNADGFDEVIIHQSALKRRQFDNYYFSYLSAFDVKNKRQIPLGDTLAATNLASTPWIGDLDGDHFYDIICSSVQYENALLDLQKPQGLYIRRFKTSISISKPTAWGAFMGSDYRGRVSY